MVGKPCDVDIVFDRDGNAVQRQLCCVLFGERFGFRQRLSFIAQADEDGGVVMVANPRKTARDGLRGRHGAGAMGGDNLGDGFGHVMPRPLADVAMIDGAPERKLYLNRSKRCAIVYICAEDRDEKITKNCQLLRTISGEYEVIVFGLSKLVLLIF